MVISFINHSQNTVIIKENDNVHELLSNQQIHVTCNSNEMNCYIVPQIESSFKEFGNTIIEYNFVLESLFNISSVHDNVEIELNVIKVSGDYREFYSYINPLSLDATIDFCSAEIVDKADIRNKIFQSKSFLKTANRNPKNSKKFELFLDTLLGGTPLAIIFYLTAKTHFSGTAILLAVLPAFLISFITVYIVTSLFGKLLKNHNRNSSKPIGVTEEVNTYFKPNYISSVILDTERYKNYC